MTRKTLIKKDRGVALLFAVLVAGLLMSIGLAIYNLSVWELLLSYARRESLYAFYAAESGVECAIYWDARQKFPRELALGADENLAPTTIEGIACGNGSAGNDVNGTITIPFGSSEPMINAVTYGTITEDDDTIRPYAETRFYFGISPTIGGEGDSKIPSLCSYVTVTKGMKTVDGSLRHVTTIRSKGFNTSCDLGGSRVLERELVYRYY